MNLITLKRPTQLFKGYSCQPLFPIALKAKGDLYTN
jgi:hypothetical protein